MRKSIEVAAEICIYDFSMASVDQLVDMFHCVQRAAVSPIGVLFRLQIGLEYGFENQNCRRLRYPVADSGDSQRKLHTNTVSCWDGPRSGILFTHFVGKAFQYLRHGA
jgi:hypothetical protein